MNDPTAKPLDLSSLPAPVRAALMRQLDKMPRPLREKLLAEGSPILERVLAKVREQHANGAGASSPPPLPRESAHALAASSRPVWDRYEQSMKHRVPTVIPGDSGSHLSLLLAEAIAIVVAVWYAWFW